MSVRDEVLSEQDQQLEDLPEEIQAKTHALYDSIGALSPEQRGLLVSQALAHASSLTQQVAAGGSASLLTLVTGMIAIAGYSNELAREEAGHTATGDRKVTAVIDSYRELCRDMVASQMSPEQKARAEAMAERVNARMQAGEDFSTAVANVQAAEGHQHVAANSDSEQEGFGLYL